MSDFDSDYVVSSDEQTPDAASRPRRRISWLRAVVMIAFALFFAYDLFEAVSNLFGVTAQIGDYNSAAAEIGLGAVAVPWTLLIANIAVPPVFYVVAVLLSRRRALGYAVLLFAAALAASAALSLSLATFA